MIRFLLDSNTVSGLLRRDPQLQKKIHLARKTNSPLILSPVVEFEVLRGIAHLEMTRTRQDFDRLQRRLVYVSFGRSTWARAAEIWAYSRKEGAPIADADVLIAAQALELEARLVTANVKHFEVFEPLGLVVENWKTE